jgi:hypothetical protein
LEELRTSACWWSKGEPGSLKYQEPFSRTHWSVLVWIAWPWTHLPYPHSRYLQRQLVHFSFDT